MEIHKKAAKMVHSGVHVARHPGRILSHPIKKRLEKHGWKHRVFDVVSISIVCGIIAFVSWYYLFNVDPGRKVDFTAVVAPASIVSGGESTLAISYQNNSKRVLGDVTLTLEYPPYFALNDVEHDAFEETTNTISVGELAPGAHGLVKLRGVMFGDVNGTQTFASTLGYSWDGAKHGSRRQTYTFSPVKSALQITTELPDKLVAGQRLNGSIFLKNNGTLAFPEEAIHAVFPEGFTLYTTSLLQRDDQTWIVPTLDPGEELEITYSGTLAIESGEDATFYFEPSFLFGDERFLQETLSETVQTLPPPIELEISLPDDLTANQSVKASVTWNAQNDLAVSDVKISIEGGTNEPSWNIDIPVASGTREATIVPHAGNGANRTVTFFPVVEFTLDATGDRVQVVGKSVERKVTTSATVESFARYFTSAGDQLGRGPLPPRVGDDTIYWLFLNVKGTINDVSNGVVTATLPGNVNWVDKQSVTKGSGVTYDPATRVIEWRIGDFPATITSGQIAAASVAVSIVPTEAQIGTTPPLLNNITFKGTDTFTGEAVRRGAGAITTAIPQDSGRVR